MASRRRSGAGYADAVGLTVARAALLGMSDGDADAVQAAWDERDRVAVCEDGNESEDSQ